MHARPLVWIALLAGFTPGAQCAAQDPASEITLRITAVKESDWQREMAKETTSDGLRERLNARTLVELTGPMQPHQPTVLRSGKEQSIVTVWSFADNRDDVVAKERTQQFIGTELTVEEVSDSRLSLILTHDLRPLQLQSLTYATAATEEERARRSVTAPRFERLHWEGLVQAGLQERVIATFRTKTDADRRIVIFFQNGNAAAGAASSATLQQTIYRVPELEMIEWLLKTERDDSAVASHLQEAVTAGQASIVSSLTTTSSTRRTLMQTGTEWWVPTEVDQNLDRLYQLPVSFETFLEGSRVLVDPSEETFESFYSPHAPLAVQWPTSWLRVHDRLLQKPTGKAICGWMDWYDRFEQEIRRASLSDSAAPQVLAMMPPADQLWGAERQGRWLDVTVVQKPSDGHSPHPANDPPAPAAQRETAPAHSLFLGICLDNETAHALLEARQPEQDHALLRDLLARVRGGKARMLTSAFSTDGSSRHALTSARIHAYPTEMPSVASAWEDEFVGTSVEQDGQAMALTHHLAPPARTEWKLARDMPEAIMWEPRFRKLSLLSTTSAATQPGAHLLAAVTVPAVMDSPDLPAGETVFLFAHRDSHGAAPASSPQDCELETLIFEIPTTDADQWHAVKTDDFSAFTRQQIKKGRATLKSHLLLRTQSAGTAKLSVVESYLTATEFDPPSREAPFRMRPTALQELPVGLSLEAEPTQETQGSTRLKFSLQCSTAKPVEPGLDETLRISADQNARYPGAKHEFDEWTEGLGLVPGGWHRLLPPSTTSSDNGTTRSAWVRVRPVK